MAWLSGWDNRIKITIDNSKVDAELSHFPITVIGSSTQLEEVFVEISDANRKKIAFTKADGATELYAEIELYNQAGEKAVWHVSRSGWTISSSEDTDLYLYYDSGHADNSTYIGDIGARTEVWDANFKVVQHMVDTTSSTITDSTNNSNDGTKKNDNEPVEVAGKVGQGQDFDGTDDYISLGDGVLNAQTVGTVEAITRPHALYDAGGTGNILGVADSNEANYLWSFQLYTAAFQNFVRVGRNYPQVDYIYGDTSLAVDTWYYVALTGDDSDWAMYVNDHTESLNASNGTNTGGWWDEITSVNTTRYKIGALPRSSGDIAKHHGDIDEFRISSTVRSVAWLNATYSTLYDALLTYGDQEVLADIGGDAIPVIESYEDSNDASTTEITLAYPSGITVGDFLMLVVGNDYDQSTPVFNAVAGYTKLGEEGDSASDAHVVVYYKIADADDIDTNVVVTQTVSMDVWGRFLRMSGVNPDHPITYNTGNENWTLDAGVEPSSPAPITTVNSNVLCVTVWAFDGADGTFGVTGTGWSQYGPTIKCGTGAFNASGGMATRDQATPGAGVACVVAADPGDGLVAVSFGINSASASGPSLPLFIIERLGLQPFGGMM